MTSYPPGFVDPRTPIHPEPGVYILKNDALQETAKEILHLAAHEHVLKIGTTGDFDTRRKTVNGEMVDVYYRSHPYFGVSGWYLARFKPFDESDEAARYEREVHHALDDKRISIDQAAQLSRAHKCELWEKQTRPELFVMSLADPLLIKLIPSDPDRAKRPRDKASNYKRYIKNDF